MIENKNSEIIPENILGNGTYRACMASALAFPPSAPVRLEVRPSNRMGHAVLAHQA
jgi:hypothetical protein